jgi:hypothetical protein
LVFKSTAPQTSFMCIFYCALDEVCGRDRCRYSSTLYIWNWTCLKDMEKYILHVQIV